MADPAPPVERWPLVAAGLAAALLIVLIGGVLLARRTSPLDPSESPDAISTQVKPRATSQPTMRLTATPPPPTATPRAAAQTTGGATPTSVPAAAASPRSATTPAATASSQFTIVLANGTPRIVPGNATVAPQPTPQEWWNQSNTVSPDLAAELSTAFQHFWQVRAQALLDLDPGPLAEVADGQEFQREVALLDSLRAQNQAEQLDVQHHMNITHATATDATVLDDYVARAVPLDLTTDATLTPTPSTMWHLAYHFQKLGGTWKVVEAIQLAYE